MSISPGTKLAHYEILEPIGRGGMGEVYRAKDETLDRDVAIKVLPEAFALDEERLRRFRREAKVLASLNHPNIATIYGFEQSGSTSFLAMEYASGETLSERIARGPIPVPEALEIAKQIAAALEEAHAQGVVHRDLKPANVKLTENDDVKVLDFGLAKAFTEDGPGDGESAAAASLSPTITRDATRAGVILGTAAYMSPEQAKGKRVDKRADIWAFGAVLYEMLTSRRAFAGEDISDTLAAILRSEPDWEALPRDFPPSLQAYLKRCLAKDKSARIRDIGDLRLALDGAFEVEASEPPPAVTPTRRAHPGVWAAALPATAVFTALVVWTMARAPVPTGVVSRFAVAPPEGVRIANRRGFDVIISPDGTQLAFLGEREGERRVYIRAIGELEAKELAGTESADDPFFSPDGKWIGFESARQRRLMRAPLDGGPPLTIGDYEQTRGAVWGEEGIFFATRDGLFRVLPSGGEPESLVTGSGVYSEPRILPGGRAIVFALLTGPRLEEENIVALSLQSGEQSLLVTSGSNPYYAASGHLLFERGYTLMAVRFDPSTLRVLGDPVPVVNSVRRSGSAAADYAVSETGTLVYITGREESDLRNLIWASRNGETERVAVEPKRFFGPRISHDGERIAATIMDGSGRSDIWEISLSRSSLTRLTFDGNAVSPIFMPESERLAYVARGPGSRFVFALPTGSNQPEQIVEVPATFRLNDGTSDGQVLIGSAFSQDTLLDIVIAEAGREPSVLLGSRFSELHPSLSPDGGYLAYVSDESGRSEVYVTPFPDASVKVAVSTEGGSEPAWSPDGREIFFRNGDAIWAVAIVTGDSPEVVGRPERRFEATSSSRETFVRSYDVHPSGDRVLLLEEPGADDTRVHVVLNWLEELERLVPHEK